MIKIFIHFILTFYISSLATTVIAEEPISEIFTEDFGGERPGFRYKISNVKIEGGQNSLVSATGGLFNIEMQVLHDCESCGNAINQIIVGLSSDEKAQVSVWNGKKRSGGPTKVVNYGSNLECLAQDNNDKAEWVKVYFSLNVPNEEGVYYIRTRYAQAYTGNLMTHQARKIEQKKFAEPLGWWKVDRPEGPNAESNIGKIVVEPSH